MKKSHVHFMGIGGQGISAAAQMAQMNGESVTGCDRQASATTRALERAGIPIQIGHSADHLTDADMLVISPAVPALDPQNPELLAARRQGIRIVTWQELLGELMRDKCVLSVSGVHGKSTTTTMLSLMLIDANLDPTCVIGAVVPRLGTNYRLGKSQYIVNEADEFNYNFLHYHPRLAIVTAVEFEHPEFYADYAMFLGAFERFVRGMDVQGNWSLPPTLIVNADSAGCLELCSKLNDFPVRIVKYSIEQREHTERERPQELTFTAYDVKLAGETSFRVRASQPEVNAAFANQVFSLQIPGLHNIQNALAAICGAYLTGIDVAGMARTLESFTGARRRFEIRHQGALALDGQTQEVVLVDDYAHHPTAIEATLIAARQRYPGRRLIAVYQPHMYSRTKTFFEQFLSAFDVADLAILVDIFPARERDTGLIHTRNLVEEIAQRPHFTKGDAQVLYGGSIQNTARLLTKTLQTGDVVVIMGAGDIYMVTEQLLQNVSLA